MKRTLAIAFLLWSIALGVGAFFYGCHVQENADFAAQADARENENELVRIKNRKAVGAGIRTEKAQAKTEVFFQELRADYENDQKQNPDAGCVLDPVSLLRWNQANTQSDGDATGESDAGVQQDATDPEEGRQRGE